MIRKSLWIQSANRKAPQDGTSIQALADPQEILGVAARLLLPLIQARGFATPQRLSPRQVSLAFYYAFFVPWFRENVIAVRRHYGLEPAPIPVRDSSPDGSIEMRRPLNAIQIPSTNHPFMFDIERSILDFALHGRPPILPDYEVSFHSIDNGGSAEVSRCAFYVYSASVSPRTCVDDFQAKKQSGLAAKSGGVVSPREFRLTDAHWIDAVHPFLFFEVLAPWPHPNVLEAHIKEILKRRKWFPKERRGDLSRWVRLWATYTMTRLSQMSNRDAMRQWDDAVKAFQRTAFANYPKWGISPGPTGNAEVSFAQEKRRIEEVIQGLPDWRLKSCP